MWSQKYSCCHIINRVDVMIWPILWPPDAKSWLIGKDPDAWKDEGQEEKGTTEDEMVGWHHQFDGHKFEQALGVGDGQGGLACCDSWGRKESDMPAQLNWTELIGYQKILGVIPCAMGLPWWLSGKESAWAGDGGLILGSGRSPGEGNGNPLQHSCLGNPMDRGTWQAIVHGITKESDMIWQLKQTKMKSPVLYSKSLLLTYFMYSSLYLLIPYS